MNDILLIGNNREYLMTTMMWTLSSLDVKDMGETQFFLEVKIQRNRSKQMLTYSQESNIKEVLERFEKIDYDPTDTLIAKRLNTNS